MYKLNPWIAQLYDKFHSLFLFIWQTGSERNADSIRKKIDQLISSYRKTSDWIANTGEGIRSNESAESWNQLILNRFKYFFILEPVMSDRPTSRPVFTTDDFDSFDYNDRQECSASSDSDEGLEMEDGSQGETNDMVPRSVTVNEPTISTPTHGVANQNMTLSSQRSVLSTASSTSKVAKRPASAIKESLKMKKSNNGKGDIILATSNKMDDYYDSKTVIANKKFELHAKKLQIEEETLKYEARQTLAKSNLEVMRCRKEAREIDPALTEEQLNDLFPFH